MIMSSPDDKLCKGQSVLAIVQIILLPQDAPRQGGWWIVRSILGKGSRMTSTILLRAYVIHRSR
jgi:hypothetical protein